MIENRNIPVVIFAGGRGTRFDHETQVMPKPMIAVCGRPIIDHIIDGFHDQGFREFIVLTGYLGNVIDSHFLGLAESKRGTKYILEKGWNDEFSVEVVDTGQHSHTGMRLWNARDRIGRSRRFILTYGDGLSDVDMAAVIRQHDASHAVVTMTVVKPPGRFGIVNFDPSPDSSKVLDFSEKSSNDWINGGFMVVEPEFIDSYIDGGLELETDALPRAARAGVLHAYRHDGFWACMDTRRDRDSIEQGVDRSGSFPWRKYA